MSTQQPRIAAEALAAALGITERSARRRATRESWQYDEQPGRGGRRRLYLVSSLPAEVRQALAESAFSAASAGRSPLPLTPADAFSSSRGRGSGAETACAVSGSSPEPRSDLAPAVGELVPSPVGSLARWQLDVAAARAALLDECERIAAAASISIARAEQLLVERARRGELGVLEETARQANARRGSDGRRSLSVQRLMAWRSSVRSATTPAERISILAPRGRGKRWGLTDDVAAALAKYRQPNKPPLRWCVKEVVGEDGGPAFNSLYARCRRELAKLPAPIFYKGRNTGSALRALAPFRRREFLSLEPNDVWVGDGHSAKLRVAHPDTGNPFVPEVTVIMDVPSRYVVGWSVSLSENCLAVSDALRHGISRHGVPLVYYSDNGGGQKNLMFDAPITGVLGALGIHHETGIAGNPQGRGVIERFWQTVLMPLARRFATYRGAGHDRETLRNVSQEIDRTLRAAARGEVTALPRRLPAWQQFIDALEEEIEAYNAVHRHRSLPKLDGAVHATPAEYRAKRLSGAAPQIPQPQELAALFMPSVLRTAARGEVRLWNGIYFHRDLMLADREEVRVCYDIHDAGYVLVRRLSGEFICRAELGGNRSGYFPQPFIERLREERAQRRRGLLEKKLQEVDGERQAVTYQAPAWSDEERAALEADAMQPAAQPIELMGEMDRYAHWKKLHARVASGERLQDSETAFYEGFKDTAQLYLAEEREFEARTGP